MATNLDTTITASVTSTMRKDTAPLVPVNSTGLESVSVDAYSVSVTSAYTFGTDANKAKGHWHGQWTCAGGGNQVIFDLDDVLEDVFGDKIIALEVKAIYLHNLSTVSGEFLGVVGDVVPGNEIRFTLAAADAVNLHPDGIFLLTSPIDGYPVAAANCTIEINNTRGPAIDFEIFVLYEY